jgi:hypothetical protein
MLRLASSICAKCPGSVRNWLILAAKASPVNAIIRVGSVAAGWQSIGILTETGSVLHPVAPRQTNQANQPVTILSAQPAQELDLSVCRNYTS